MSDTPKDDEADKRRDEILKRLLKMPPKPHKPKDGADDQHKASNVAAPVEGAGDEGHRPPARRKR